jgi:hypothetical protein
MDDNFDLLGDPIPGNHGRRGRPQHVPTTRNRNRVSMLVAMGWSNERIAGALDCTLPTLRKYYFSELRLREVARDRIDSEVLMKLWEGVKAGSVSAIRQFRAEVERNDLMTFGQKNKPRAEKPAAEKPAPAARVGKKEAAELAAHQPDQGTPLGELMARRQQGLYS